MSDDISERERFEAEQKLKQAELAIKEREVAVKELEAQRGDRFFGRLGPVGMGVFVAAIGLIGAVITTTMQGAYQREVERTKSEGNLIVELVKVANHELAQKNIQWFIRAGFIRDPDGRIHAAIENVNDVPCLPSQRFVIPEQASRSSPEQTSLLLEHISQASLFTPEEQAQLDQIKDPKERATFALSKITERENLLAPILSEMNCMLSETAKSIAKHLR
jgi:hypothetical protein